MFFHNRTMRYLFLFIAVLSVLFFGSIPAEAAQSYRVVIGPGQTTRVYEHSICRYVTNNGASDIFVPTNTANEWSLFRSNKPAYVALGYCYQCPTTGSIYPAQTTCDTACTQTANCNQSAISISGNAGQVWCMGNQLGASGSAIYGPGDDSGQSINIPGCTLSGPNVSSSVCDGCYGCINLANTSLTAINSYTIKVVGMPVCEAQIMDATCANFFYEKEYYNGEIFRSCGPTCEEGPVYVGQNTVNWTVSGCTVSGAISSAKAGRAGFLLYGSGDKVLPTSGSGSLSFSSTYSCPLSGGSACDGNHQCTASQICITLP